MSALVAALLARISELDRRIAGVEFRGRVKEVDGEKHRVKMVIGTDPDGEDVLSPWLPVGQVAGALKLHSLPSVGQQIVARSASGDLQQAVAEPMHWSDGFESPSEDPDLHVLTYGSVRIDLTKNSLKIKVGETTVEITEQEIREITEHLKVTGSRMSHNDLNVGHDHRHRDAGGIGNSGIPLP